MTGKKTNGAGTALVASRYPDLPLCIRENLTDDERAILIEEDPEKVRAFMDSGPEIMLLGVRRMVVGYWRLRQLGTPREELRIGFPYLEQMAYGQVLIELVLRFAASKRRLLDLAAGLPVPDQQDFAENKSVLVMEAGGGHRMVAPEAMTAKQIEQVFDGKGRLRSDAEQAQYLSDLQKANTLAGPVEEEPVKIVGTKVIVSRPTVFTASRWHAIDEDLQRRKKRKAK